MILVIGLGNIGDRYKNTRHNIGFMVADGLADELGLTFSSSKHHALIAKGKGMAIVKPTTLMNDSGQAVHALQAFYKLPTESIWVIHDELDLELGKVRIRLGGLSTHNGIRSIIENIGSDYWRIKLGISGQRHSDMETDDYVLSRFLDNEKVVVGDMVSKSVDLLQAGLHQETLEHTSI